MRAVGLDLGSVRIGVAVSDSAGTMAVPSSTLRRGRSWDVDHAAIAEAVAEAEAEVVVVGLPLSMDGSAGPAVRRTRKEVARLTRTLEVPVETYDERLSTVHAQRMLHEAGFDTAGSRRHVDSSAAAVILQGWLDQMRSDDQEDPDSDAPRP